VELALDIVEFVIPAFPENVLDDVGGAQFGVPQDMATGEIDASAIAKISCFILVILYVG
jgi:hypothetical protein